MIRASIDKTRSPLEILCLGAHSDDIEIGCGAALRRLIDERGGDVVVNWVVFSAPPERRSEAKRSADVMLGRAGSKTVAIENFEDGYFPYSGGAIKKYMHDMSRHVSPDLIFTHYAGDRHQDHRLIAELTWNEFRNHWVLEYEVPKYDGDLGAPNVFVSLTESDCRSKVDHLLEHFESQRQKAWFTRETFLALLRLRGIESNAAGGYAEAFYCRKTVF